MTKSELLNNVFFENAKGDLPIIYITSDDDVVKVGGIINAPMVGRIYFSEVKKTITKDELLANKEFICASEDSEILIDFGGVTYYGGVTYSDAVRKSDRRRGVLVSFPCQVMSMNYCCHAIEEYTDLEHGGEPSAYLMGWIASCINKARLGIGNFVEIKDKEK